MWTCARLRWLILALVTHSTSGSRPPPKEGGFEEAERKEITELNTSLEQAFSFQCHNISPFPYMRISTNTWSSRKQYTRGNGNLRREASWFWRSVILWHQLRRCPHQLSCILTDGKEEVIDARLSDFQIVSSLHFSSSMSALEALDLTCSR